MTLDIPSNLARVARIVEALDLIGKSAQSNRATREEKAELLAPVVASLHALGALQGRPAPSGALAPAPEPQSPPPGRIGATAPSWASVLDMAREAPIEDLAGALVVIASRLAGREEELRRKK